MEHLAVLHQYMEGFKGDDLSEWMKHHTEVPVIFVTLYLGLVFYGQDLMKDKKPMTLKALFTLWNFLLAVFSIAGCYYTAPAMINALMKHGFYYTACSAPPVWYFNGTVGFWTAAFILSKIPELIDTVFLVIQKKPVIFLHWYHHTTVMLYCWHAYVNVVAPGMWFASMNYFVHSIMYSYYFLTNLSGFTRKLVRPFAQTITTLQLLQMVVGMFVTVYTWYYSTTAKGCATDQANTRMALLMYTSYFVLFAALFKKLYLTKGGKHAKKPTAEESVCSSATAAMNTLNTGSPTSAKPKAA